MDKKANIQYNKKKLQVINFQCHSLKRLKVTVYVAKVLAISNLINNFLSFDAHYRQKLCVICITDYMQKLKKKNRQTEAGLSPKL